MERRLGTPQRNSATAKRRGNRKGKLQGITQKATEAKTAATTPAQSKSPEDGLIVVTPSALRFEALKTRINMNKNMKDQQLSAEILQIIQEIVMLVTSCSDKYLLK